MASQTLVSNLITAARSHLGKGVMDSSARLCLADAIELFDVGNFDRAKTRALKSIAYSVGIVHPDYIKFVGEGR